MVLFILLSDKYVSHVYNGKYLVMVGYLWNDKKKKLVKNG